MANEEDWKPRGRPTSYACLVNSSQTLLKAGSMIAKDFSADLNDAFAMDSSLDGLVQSVQQR